MNVTDEEILESVEDELVINSHDDMVHDVFETSIIFLCANY